MTAKKISFEWDTTDYILINDWTGKELFYGNCFDNEVDLVLEANRCSTCACGGFPCKECDGTGYGGDFTIEWVDTTRKDNVYEFVNY